jgi:ADP-heptose:LPS heptosyltransferase
VRELKSILVLRPDRLGDVIVSTPVHRVLREQFPKAKIHWLVQDWIAPLLVGLEGMSSVVRYQPRGEHQGQAGFQKLISELRALQPDAVIALQHTPRVSWAARLAGVPMRVGPLSKFSSYLLFNQGVRQSRSRSVKHEAEYGLDLLRALGVKSEAWQTAREKGPEVQITDLALQWAQAWLSARGLKPGEAVGIHPGMGGSALNWPQERYIELTKSFATAGTPVILTAGAGEAGLQRAILEAARNWSQEAQARVHPISAEADGMDLMRLAALQSLLKNYIAPSTGPLHLASAVGTKVASVYPPIQVQHPRRWGPFVSPEKAHVLTPVSEAQCGQKYQCKGAACSLYPCMARVSAQDVAQALAQDVAHALGFK